MSRKTGPSVASSTCTTPWRPGRCVAFASAREGLDTSTAIGRLLMNLLASLAEFELEVLSERVRARMERARREGKTIGRPKVMDREEVRQRLHEVRTRIEAGEVSRN